MTSLWVGDLVRLRGVEPEDWEPLHAFDANTHDARRAGRILPPRSAAGQREWAQKLALKESENDRMMLTIESLADRAPVGLISTAMADYHAGRFQYGITIGNQHQGRGYGTESVRLLLGYMFGERRFHKCESGVWAFNDASIALHRKLGYTEEGRLRDHEFFAGRHHDMVMFGMLAAEFADRHPFPREI
ncbi:GNAT family N-acetyltransferase [Lentzea sp. JNUCC 0626]|uniref:GNAT family N-acetyltransferase n=1 Tax=Lentzea sp. JNUCC 0626 TaxID=3367513 RepID=UPI00374A0994